jgi:hypothetical protein
VYLPGLVNFSKYIDKNKLFYVDIDTYSLTMPLDHSKKILLDRILDESSKKKILIAEQLPYPYFKDIIALEPGGFFKEASLVKLRYPKNKYDTILDKVALLGTKSMLDVAKKLGPDIEYEPNLIDTDMYRYICTDYSFDNFWGCQRTGVYRLPSGDVQRERWRINVY